MLKWALFKEYLVLVTYLFFILQKFMMTFHETGQVHAKVIIDLILSILRLLLNKF